MVTSATTARSSAPGPSTKKHVYEDGWLRRFFDALLENSDWLTVCTLADAVDNVPPEGRVYLPDFVS